MKHTLFSGIAVAVLAGFSGLPVARAQEKPPATPPAPAVHVDAPASCPCGASHGEVPCKKVAVPAIEKVKHTCIRYDVKEEDYCTTKCVHSPIFSIFCRSCCGKSDCCHDETEPCHQCGHPYTRRVLIKEIVTEEVPTPRCKVERVPVPGCGTGKPSCEP